MFMRFRYSFTFKSDFKPTHTVRGEFEKTDYETAFKSAVFLAAKEKPTGKWRSYVCCIEAIEIPKDAKIGDSVADEPQPA